LKDSASFAIKNGCYILYNPENTSYSVETSKDSFCQLFIVLEGVEGKQEIEVSVGEGAKLELVIIVNNYHTSLSLTTKLFHSFPNSTSSCLVRSVLGGASHLNFLGSIYVSELATGTNGYLNHKTLLLDDSSSVITKPELVIKNDDVKCSHGATVSSLDHDIANFLSSRGLTSKQIIDLSVETFFKPLWEK
jgi:Fe-S cluster assembly protein SufD